MSVFLHTIFCFTAKLVPTFRESQRRKVFLSIASFLLPICLFSQTTEEEKNQIIEQRIEYLTDTEESSDIDYTNIFEQLNYYFDHPINLNRASSNDLRELSLLSDIQINNLISHIEKNGKLMTLEELQTIDGFNTSTIRLIMPFIKVSTDIDSPQLSLNELLKKGENQVFIRFERVLEEKEGFSPTTDSALVASPNSRYLGDRNRIYTRYKYNYGNHISFGITAEKDAGEEFFKGSQPNGFDFYSAHFFLRNQGKIKQLAIGDYQAQFGQGLTFWSGLAFGKSADIMLVKRSAVGLKPYTSADENLFMRGAGITLNFDEIEITSFYSRNSVDANIDLLDTTSFDDDVAVITSFQQTGFHRTKNEIEDKDAIVKQTMGGHLAYKTRKLNIGFTGVYNAIDVNFNPSLSTYSQFRNTDSKQINLGVDYNWIFKNFNFFGEVAKSTNGGIAFVSTYPTTPSFVAILYILSPGDFFKIAIGVPAANSPTRSIFPARNGDTYLSCVDFSKTVYADGTFSGGSPLYNCCPFVRCSGRYGVRVESQCAGRGY